MQEPYKGYIEVMVLPDTLDEAGWVKVKAPAGLILREYLGNIVMEPEQLKPAAEVSADEVVELRQALDAAQSEKTCALNEASYWRQRAHEMRDENLYLTGVVDAAKSLSDLTMPARDVNAYGL